MPSKKISKRNPEQTRTRILESAIECFAELGYHGTGLNEICQRAQVNKRMIYHYFDSKEGLYLAVHEKGWLELEEGFMREMQGQKPEALAQKSIQDLLMEVVEVFHDFMASHQLFLRLMLWDGLEGGFASRGLWERIRGPLYRQMETLVIAAQEQKVLPSHFLPSHFIISIMGAIFFYYSHAHTMIDIFQKETLSTEAIHERKEQVLLLFKKFFFETNQEDEKKI